MYVYIVYIQKKIFIRDTKLKLNFPALLWYWYLPGRRNSILSSVLKLNDLFKTNLKVFKTIFCWFLE